MANDNKPEFVTVKGASMDGKVVLWESHPDQVTKDNETGEIFIANDGRSHTVARTPEVEKRLRDRTLVESNDKPVSPATPKPEAAGMRVENIGRSTSKG
jgi:hypothetical protein